MTKQFIKSKYYDEAWQHVFGQEEYLPVGDEPEEDLDEEEEDGADETTCVDDLLQHGFWRFK